MHVYIRKEAGDARFVSIAFDPSEPVFVESLLFVLVPGRARLHRRRIMLVNGRKAREMSLERRPRRGLARGTGRGAAGGGREIEEESRKKIGEGSIEQLTNWN